MRMSTWASTVVRVLLGAIFVLSGANKLVPFIPAPPMPDAAWAFVSAMLATGYFMPLLAVVEVVSGLLLITGQFVPLALVVLAPIVVQIAFFHALLAPNPVTVLLVVGAELFLAWQYRQAFEPLLRRRSSHAQSLRARPFVVADEPLA